MNRPRVSKGWATFIDARSKTTTFAYDDAGRKIVETNPQSQSRLWAYDNAGKLTSQTDPRPPSGTFGYDALNRRTLETWSVREEKGHH